MAKENNWKIEKVDREKGIVTVIYNSEEYSFTLKKEKIVCLSKKILMTKLSENTKNSFGQY